MTADRIWAAFELNDLSKLIRAADPGRCSVYPAAAMCRN
jgi:hypothetical protein